MLAHILFYLFLINPPDCKKEVEQAYLQMKQLSLPDGAFQVKYSMNTTTWDNQSTKQVTEISKKGNKVRISSGDIDVYQDAGSILMINRQDQNIFITKPVPQNSKNDQLKAFTIVFDSLFQYIQVRSCDTEFADAKKSFRYRKISFSIPTEISSTTGLASITYWMLEDKPEIKRIYMEYIQGAALKSIDFALLNMNLNYTSEPFSASASSHVLDRTGKLLPNYRGYQFIDKRK